MKKFNPFLVFGTFLIAVTVLIVGRYVYAADVSSVSVADRQLPQIYVQDLNLDKKIYDVGDTVHGKFTLWNQGDRLAPDVFYEVLLVGKFVERVPQVVYDRVIYESSMLTARERKTVSFSYSLPKNFKAADLAIRVMALLKTGSGLGWADQPITLVGAALTGIEVSDISLAINGESFAPASGPTLAKGQLAVYKVTLSNPAGTAVTLTPQIAVYDSTLVGNPISSYSEESVSVPARGQKTLSLTLPDFDYKPSVYVGELKFLDPNGSLRSPLLTFRYIVEGEIATIRFVSLDKIGGKKGDVVPVVVYYSGVPFNIQTRKSSSGAIGEAILVLTLRDGSGAAVGTGQATIDFSKPERSATVPVTLNQNVSQLKILAVLSKDGKILSSYETGLLPAGTAPVATSQAPNSFLFTAVVLFIGLLAAIFWFFIRRSGKGKGGVGGASGASSGSGLDGSGSSNLSTLVLLFLVSSLLVFGFSPSPALAFVVDSSSYDPICPECTPTVFVNTPVDNGSYPMGGQFSVDGSVTYLECNNSVSYRYVATATFQGQSQSQTFRNDTNGSSSQFSVGPFTMPSSPGTYRVNLEVHIYSTNASSGQQYDDWVRGHIDVVANAAPAVNAGADQIISSPNSATLSGTVSDDGLPNPPSAVSVTWSKKSGPGTVTFGDAGASSTSVSFGSTGTYVLTLTASDGSLSASDDIQIMVNQPSITTTVIGTPNPATVGSQVTWTATPSGTCPGPFSYSWTGTDGLTGATQSVNKAYSTTGNKNATVTVSAPGCQTTVQSSVTPVVVQGINVQSVSCSASPSVVHPGVKVTWTATPTPPDAGGTYTYSWFGAVTGSTRIVYANNGYTTIGTKSATVTVTGATPKTCTTNVKVVQPATEEF